MTSDGVFSGKLNGDKKEHCSIKSHFFFLGKKCCLYQETKAYFIFLRKVEGSKESNKKEENENIIYCQCTLFQNETILSGNYFHSFIGWTKVKEIFCFEFYCFKKFTCSIFDIFCYWKCSYFDKNLTTSYNQIYIQFQCVNLWCPAAIFWLWLPTFISKKRHSFVYEELLCSYPIWHISVLMVRIAVCR